HVLATMVSRHTLSRISPGLFLFTRNLFSAVFFFLAGIILFGADHFAHAFAGPLWGLMLLYAGVVVLLGQGLWLRFSRKISPRLHRRLSYLEPVSTLLYAILWLEEIPEFWELMAILLMLGGMAVVHFHPHEQQPPSLLQESPNVAGR
ncbi:MAG: DMT family transporter, partial [Bacteroidota bacterium]